MNSTWTIKYTHHIWTFDCYWMEFASQTIQMHTELEKMLFCAPRNFHRRIRRPIDMEIQPSFYHGIRKKNLYSVYQKEGNASNI